MTFGEKVKAERTKLGLNQDELAEKNRRNPTCNLFL